MKRLLQVLTVASVMGCVLLGMVLPISYHVRLCSYDETSRKWIQEYSIGFGTHFRMGFENGSIWSYNYEKPWYGGTRFMADEKGIIYQGGHAHTVKNLWSFCYYYTIGQVAIIGEKGELVERDKVCQLPGIYYIHYDASGYPPPMWTLAISLWYLLILFAILPALWIYRYERLRCFKKKV